MTGFTLRDVPAAMRRSGWPVGARLMERWFARSGSKMPDDVKRGVVESAYYGGVDDFYAAFGNALVRLAVTGMVERDGRTWQIRIDEVGTYLRDSYDFNGDQRLGSWGPDGLRRTAFAAPMKEVDERKRRDVPGQAYWRVGNSSFESHRRLTGTGGDFMVYSDVRRQKRDPPVVVPVRA